MRSERGQATVEAAAVLSLLLIVALTAVTLGYWLLAEMLVSTSASQGGRYGAAVYGDTGDLLLAQAAARGEAEKCLTGRAGPKGVQVWVDGPDLVVESTYTFRVFAPLGRSEVPLTAAARYRLQN